MKVYDAAALRNVALVGHGGSGKTQLASAMLFAAGAVTRLGKVDDGSTTTDFDDEEIARKHTLSSSLAYAAWQKGVRIFDSSLGGVGGSAAASAVSGGGGMVGNIATESLVAMFEGMGVRTGIDVDALMTGAGPVLNEIFVEAGEFSPPSGMLRERLGYGGRWVELQRALDSKGR